MIQLAWRFFCTPMLPRHRHARGMDDMDLDTTHEAPQANMVRRSSTQEIGRWRWPPEIG